MFALCAVFGHPEASRLVFLMLYAMQHRIKMSRECHIFSLEEGLIHHQEGRGQVRSIFSEAILRTLPGDVAVGIGSTFENQASYHFVEAPQEIRLLVAAGNNPGSLAIDQFFREPLGFRQAILVSDHGLAVRRDLWGLAPLAISRFRDDREFVATATEQVAFSLLAGQETMRFLILPFPNFVPMASFMCSIQRLWSLDMIRS